MSVEERARLVLDPDMDKAIRALLSVIDTEKKVGDEAKSVAAKREQIEAEFSKKAFDLSHNRVEILKKEFSESLAEAEKYGAKRESIEKYYNKAINDARADALATQGQKLSQMGGALTLGVTTPLVAAGVAGLKFAASMESSAVKYGVLLGDMSKGIPFTEELKKLAAQTPLAFQGLDQAAQTLLGFQVSSDGLTDTLRMLGDLAKGNSEKLQGVALAYGQMSAAGRANMQDLNQLINAGVPILGALATSMGKPVPEIRKMVEEGKVGFSDVDKALKGLVDEGGLFHDMMKKVAETAEGKLSTALDSLKDAAGSAMESLIPLAKDLLEGVTGAAEKFSALDENSRRAILTILGMAAVSGPIMTATGGVMQLVAAYQKLDKAALVAKLTMLASNPVGWAIAGAAAIAGGIALINKAERDHEKALRDKAGAYKETAAEGAALAKEYQTLYDKTKLSADEQKRMVDLAQILKEKYPDLTQDTLNLAAANKTLADKVDEAALATARKAAGELLPKVESRYTQAVKELGNFSQILEKLKKLPDGGTYLGISKAETKTYEGYVAALRDEVAALQSDIETYKETLYGIPKNPNAKPIITPPSSGSNSSTTTTVKQGDRLAALDREYEARVALAKKLGEDVYSVEEEWAKKKYDMLQGFVLEDVKNGKSYETSLVLDLSGSYGALGTELDKAKEKLKEYARAQDDAALVASLSDNANEAKWAAMAAETAAQVLALQEGVKLMEEKAATDKAIQDYLSDNANETKWAAMAAETAAQVLALQEGVKLMEEKAATDKAIQDYLSDNANETKWAAMAAETAAQVLALQEGVKLMEEKAATDKAIQDYLSDNANETKWAAMAAETAAQVLALQEGVKLMEEKAATDKAIQDYLSDNANETKWAAMAAETAAQVLALQEGVKLMEEKAATDKAIQDYLSDNANETKWAAMAAETAAQVLALQEGVKLMEEKAATDKAIQDYLSDNANETKWAAMAAETAAQVLALQEGVKLMEERQKLPGILSGIGGQTGKALSAFTTLSNGLETKYKITLISDPAKDELLKFVKDSKDGLSELAAAGERLLGEMFRSIKDNAAAALKEELAGINDRIEAYNKSSSRQLDLLRRNGADTVAFELQMNAKKESLEKQKAAKEYAIGKKEFEIEKNAKLGEIAMNTALGIAKAWANPITAPFITALIGGIGIAQAAIVASQEYPAAYEGAFIPGSPSGMIIRAGERNQDELILPLRKEKIDELGFSRSAAIVYIEHMTVQLPQGTSREQALDLYNQLQALRRERVIA